MHKCKIHIQMSHCVLQQSSPGPSQKDPLHGTCWRGNMLIHIIQIQIQIQIQIYLRNTKLQLPKYQTLNICQDGGGRGRGAGRSLTQVKFKNLEIEEDFF